MAFLRPHLDYSLGCRVKGGLAAATGLGLQVNLKLITFHVQLASADTQMLTDHLMAHTTKKHSNLLAAKGKIVFFSRLCPDQKFLSDSSAVTRTELKPPKALKPQ